MSEWQSIETAPRGEYVLVFSPDCNEWSQIMIARAEITDEPGDEGDWYELNGIGRPIEMVLTHWMPLPDPPGGQLP